MDIPARSASPVATSMLCAGVVTAQFIAGKAARDALYLASMDVTSLPWVVISTSVISLTLVGLSSFTLRRYAPARLVSLAFVFSALLFLLERSLVSSMPRIVAYLVYFHVSGLGPMLGSGFWLVATERFDPHSAKRQFGRIAAMGTLGGLLGGLLAERVAALFGASEMLPALAILNLACAGLVFMLSPAPDPAHRTNISEAATDIVADDPQSGLRALENARYLRNLAALVLLGTAAAAVADYSFKDQAVAALGRGDNLLRFFAVYYTGASILAFAVQTLLSRLTLEKLGVSFVVSTPSLALLAGSLGALVVPGLPSIVGARGGEQVFRSSLFRAGYELFYTPVAATERRAAKSLIDVGFDRVGDAVGGGLVRGVLFLSPAVQQQWLLGLAIACSALAIVVSSRLNRGYLLALERSLLERADDLNLTDVRDLTTKTVMLKTGALRTTAGHAQPPTEMGTSSTAESHKDSPPAAPDAVVADVAALRSRDRTRVVGILRRDEPLSMALTPHVIPLLAWDAVSDDALTALRKVCDQQVGLLVDVLLDQHQPFAVRRRLARAFSHCSSQRAVDGLSAGLSDSRFEVRFQCGRSLAAIQQRSRDVRVDRDRMLEVVLHEVNVGRPVWEMHRLLDRPDDAQRATSVDEFLKGRASQSLAHVFTLLSLWLPADALRAAYRGLQSSDERLRGTALEYLDEILPPTVREPLWPFIDSGRPLPRAQRPREKVLEDLLNLNATMAINLEELGARDDEPESARRGDKKKE